MANTKIHWRFLRPFSGAHWSFPISILAYFEFLYAGLQCNNGPYYLEAVGITVLIVLCLWRADKRCGTIYSGWHRVLQVFILGLWDLAKFIALFLLAAIPITLIIPIYQCYSERSIVAELVFYTSKATDQITAKAEAEASLSNSGIGVTLTYAKDHAIGMVLKDGIVIVVSRDPSAAFILTPSLNNGKVTWQCQGIPQKWVPANCRH